MLEHETILCKAAMTKTVRTKIFILPRNLPEQYNSSSGPEDVTKTPPEITRKCDVKH